MWDLLFLAGLAIDGAKEIMEKSRNIFVDNAEGMQSELRRKNINPADVVLVDTGKKVSDWGKIRGVVSRGDKIFAYGDSIGSELEANMNVF